MKFKRNYILIPLVTIVVAIGGSMLTNLGMGRYATLTLHPATPDGSLIGMVWTMIFIYTTLSALYFWNFFPGKKKFVTIARLFVINAVLNVLRSLLFFVLHRPLIALIEMIVLWLVTLLMFILMYRKAKLSSRLLLPYLIRVILASFFAYQTLILN